MSSSLDAHEAFTVCVQNDYDELYTLLDFVVPGGLGDRGQFVEYYELPMKYAQKKTANEHTLGKVRCSACSVIVCLVLWTVNADMCDTLSACHNV